MTATQSVQRRLAVTALVLAGAATGVILCVGCFLVLAVIGFYTLAFGTSPFLALIVSSIGVPAFWLSLRNAPPESRSRLRSFVAGHFGLLVVACVVAVVRTPELVAFWPR